MSLLTPREHAVLEKLVQGCSNKVAAHELGISSRTVEVHRARITEKLHASGLSELVRVALAARASCVHLSPYPAALKKLRHSSGLKRLQMSPMACQSSSTVLAARARRWALSLENAISIGFRSGL